MTLFQELILKSLSETKKAIDYFEKGEKSLALFRKNAAEGFLIKARKVKVSEGNI